MPHTRRTHLRALSLGSLALLTGVAGCTGNAPGTDGGDDETDDGSGLPGSDTDTGSGAGGTRPEGTGGPGVTLVSVDDDPGLPVEPQVELVRDTATADHPPRLRTTLTNTTDSLVRVGEGRAVHFAFVDDVDGHLILLPVEEESTYPAEPDCWRLTEPIAVTEEYRILDVAPDDPSSRLVDLYGTPGEDACLPVGEYRFETTISVVDEEATPQQSARWGFSVLLE